MTAHFLRRLEACRDTASGSSGSHALEAIAAALRPAQRVLVTAHINPDGDALGSAVALTLALKQLGKEAAAVFDTAAPEKLLPLLPSGVVMFLPDAAAIDALPEPDWWVVLDTNEPERAGGLKRRILAPRQRRLVLDHHLLRGSPSFDVTCIVPEAPATANLVLALIQLLNVPLSVEVAQALWVGLATDTGWFRFENTGAWALEDAATLAACGLAIPRLYQALYEEAPLGRVRLLGKVLARAQSHFHGALVVSTTSVAEASAEGLALTDLDGVVDHIKAVQGAEMAALIVETSPQSFKVSLRARGTHEVESIARKLGGGGHAKAAGCKFSGTYEALWSILKAEIGAKLERSA